jgi:CubicO group peptidase (beta-lactamase class C family)
MGHHNNGYPRIKVLALLLATALLSACGDKDDKKSAPTLTGVWQKTGYGQLWQIEGQKLVSFYHNKYGCVKSDEFSQANSSQLQAKLQLSRDGEQFNMPNDGGFIGQWHRLAQLPQSCQQPLNGNQSASVNFEFFWQDLQQYYPFFAERQVNWQALYQYYAPLFSTATKEQELKYYQAILQQIQDTHLSISTSDGNDLISIAPKGLLRSVIQQTTDTDEAMALLTQYQQELQQDTDQFLLAPGLAHSAVVPHAAFGWLPNDIAYLRLDQLNQFTTRVDQHPSDAVLGLPADLQGADALMQEVKQKFAASKALVLDLRFNLGGHDAIALQLVSHLNNATKVIGYKGLRSGSMQEVKLAAHAKPYLKPVIVLTGGMTLSAGEIMTLALKSLPQVTVIGEATQGSLSDTMQRSMPNGWTLTFGNEQYLDANKQLLEVKGITPHQQASAYLSMDQGFNSVTVLDRAMQQLQQPALQSPDQVSVQQQIRQFRQQFNQPGLAAAVIRKGQLVASFADGLANIEQQTPMTADTTVLTGSISKTILGTALALTSIDPATAIPALPFSIDWPTPRQKPLTWQDLAKHQSGIVDQELPLLCSVYLQQDGSSLFNLLNEQNPVCPVPILDQQQFLRSYLSKEGQWYQPANFINFGKAQYSNTGATLFSEAFASHTSVDLASWSAQHIFAPLQLHNTFWPTPEHAHAAKATLYIPDSQGELLPLPPYASADFYAGTLHSSANDLARYLAAVVSDKPQFPLTGLSAARRNLLLGLDQPAPHADHPGLFWHQSGDYIGHDGLFVGAQSLMYYNRATDTGVVLLLNSDGRYWLSPSAEKIEKFWQGYMQLAGQLYRHGLSL